MSTLYNIHVAPAVSSDASRLRHLPILILNVHNRCNCRCVMCDIWKRTDNVELNVVELERHRESFRSLGVSQVVLTGGEPLMHSDLSGLCNFFRQQNIRLTLLTTGLLLTKRASSVANGFDDVIVSLDGPAPVHDKIRRVPGAFSLIEQGIDAVKRLSPNLHISCRTTVQKANHNALCATVRAAKEIGLNRISFLSADVSSQAFNRTEPWGVDRQNEIALTTEELAVFENEIERMVVVYQDDIHTGYIAENAFKLRGLTNRFREHLNQTSPRAPLCNAPWVSAVVEIDGTVRPCFFHAPVGNLTHASLEETLNSSAALRFRGSLRVKDNPVCQSCVCSLNYHE